MLEVDVRVRPTLGEDALGPSAQFFRVVTWGAQAQVAEVGGGDVRRRTIALFGVATTQCRVMTR